MGAEEEEARGCAPADIRYTAVAGEGGAARWGILRADRFRVRHLPKKKMPRAAILAEVALRRRSTPRLEKSSQTSEDPAPLFFGSVV